jgi:hypothetical protein
VPASAPAMRPTSDSAPIAAHFPVALTKAQAASTFGRMVALSNSIVRSIAGVARLICLWSGWPKFAATDCTSVRISGHGPEFECQEVVLVRKRLGPAQSAGREHHHWHRTGYHDCRTALEQAVDARNLRNGDLLRYGRDAAALPPEIREVPTVRLAELMGVNVLEGAVPGRVAEIPATAQPKRTACKGSNPRDKATTNPLLKASPAPVVSTTLPTR